MVFGVGIHAFGALAAVFLAGVIAHHGHGFALVGAKACMGFGWVGHVIILGEGRGAAACPDQGKHQQSKD